MIPLPSLRALRWALYVAALAAGVYGLGYQRGVSRAIAAPEIRFAVLGVSCIDPQHPWPRWRRSAIAPNDPHVQTRANTAMRINSATVFAP